MTSTSTQYTLNTIQNNIIRDNQQYRSDLSKLQRSEASGQRFASTSEMTDKQRQQSMELYNGLGRIDQLSDSAESFLQKTKAAMSSVSRMQDKLSDFSGTLVQARTLTTDNKALLRTEISNILQTMQVELNSTYAGGGYIFASSADSQATPVGDIVSNSNYGADNRPNTNYVNNPSSSNQITVAEGMSFNADINPGDPAFRDAIAALHMMLDTLDTDATVIPTDVLNLFTTAQSEMSSFLASNLKTLYDNTEIAQEKNEERLENIQEMIQKIFQIDKLEVANLMSDIRTNMAFNTSFLESIIHLNSDRSLLDAMRG
jgi:hypothetical protein